MSVTALSNIENNKMKGVEFGTLERLAAFYEVASVCDPLELTTEAPVEKPAPGLVGSSESSYEAGRWCVVADRAWRQ